MNIVLNFYIVIKILICYEVFYVTEYYTCLPDSFSLEFNILGKWKKMRKKGNSCFFGHTVDVKIKNGLQDLRFSHQAPSKSLNS